MEQCVPGGVLRHWPLQGTLCLAGGRYVNQKDRGEEPEDRDREHAEPAA